MGETAITPGSMTPNQALTIAKIIELAQSEPDIIAVILCGSLARGTARPDSDVDVFIVVSDAHFLAAQAKKDYSWGSDFDRLLFPVEIDGKIIPKDFLFKLNERGNEPIRSTFQYAKVLFSKQPDIFDLVSGTSGEITNKVERVKQYYALMKSKRYTADDDPRNIFQVKQSIIDTVFYACRLVLAHNDVLYPSIKNLEKAVAQCQDKPEKFIELMHKLLGSFSFEDLHVFYQTVEEYFAGYSFDDKIRKGYVVENELFWYFGATPVEFC